MVPDWLSGVLIGFQSAEISLTVSQTTASFTCVSFRFRGSIKTADPIIWHQNEGFFALIAPVLHRRIAPWADRMAALTPTGWALRARPKTGVACGHDRHKTVSVSRSRAKRAFCLFFPVGREATHLPTGLAARSPVSLLPSKLMPVSHPIKYRLEFDQ